MSSSLYAQDKVSPTNPLQQGLKRNEVLDLLFFTSADRSHRPIHYNKD